MCLGNFEPLMIFFNFKITFWIFVLLWIHKGYCVVKKMVWNFRIKAFWYSKYNFVVYLSKLGSQTFGNKIFFLLCLIFIERKNVLYCILFVNSKHLMYYKIDFLLRFGLANVIDNYSIRKKSCWVCREFLTFFNAY